MSGLPKRSRGRASAAAEAEYAAKVEAFCQEIREIESTLDFKVSSRGWCYILEECIGLGKGDFDQAQALINDCRKSGLLPISICASDTTRATINLESLDYNDPEEEAEAWLRTIQNAHANYTPISFWEDQEHYVEMAVEKIDLKSLFDRVCYRYRVALTNLKGWSDINSRDAMMRRFREWERRGKQCVLLYCGDHDPGGLQISGQIIENLRQLSQAVGWDPGNLIIDRFGLNYGFIEANGLSWIDNLETSSGGRLDDPRHKDHFKPYVQDYMKRFGVRKVEANALVVRPAEGRQLCEDAIRRYVPANAITEYNAKLAVERQKVKDEIARLLAEGAT
jgi:hypothetical protein